MNEIRLRLEAFFEILSTRNVLIEIGVLAVCLLLGGIVGLELSRRNQRLRTSRRWRCRGVISPCRATW